MTDASIGPRAHEGREIRPAIASDVAAVKAVTDAAYRHYIARIGVVPQPMEADHAANVAAGRVFVTAEPGVRGEPAEPGQPGQPGQPEELAELAESGEPAEPGESTVPGRPVVAVVGLVVVEAYEDHLFLDSIAVHPHAHGKGVGSRLLAFVEARARALGLPEVRLCTNAMMWENQKIYPKYGYEVVGRRVEGSYDRIHYRKRLR